jgi:hypothetical protein
MNKSEALSRKLRQAEVYLEMARNLVNEVVKADEFGDGISAPLFDKAIDNSVDLIDDLAYEICMPLEMMENGEIDLGSGIYDAREGNEDSFSNLGME